MSTATELTASTIIERIRAGEYSRDVVMTAARGFLPLPQEDLVAVLAYLAIGTDKELSQLARASLAELPSHALLDFATSERSLPEHLALLMAAAPGDSVIEALIRNRAMPDAAIVDLAAVAGPAIQEIIVINQARILRAPAILDALLGNPSLSTDAKRRALETREEFFEKKARIEELRLVGIPDGEDGPVLADISLDPISDLLDRAMADPDAVSVAPALTEDEKKDDVKKSMWAQIQKMSVAQKIMLAFRGDKTVRSIMVRERNRLVAAAAVRNPRMTESEAEMIAGMRNLDDEVIRILSTRRDWMSKYPIVNVLCHNPKTPIGVVLPLINRLTLRDLKGLKDDKNVPEVVRQTARKFYITRTEKS